MRARVCVCSLLIIALGGLVAFSQPGDGKQAGKVATPAKNEQLAKAPISTRVDAVAVALADCKTLPALIQPYIRYLDIGDLPGPMRQVTVQILSGHVNALSRESDIVPLVLVAPNVLRVNIKDYGWDVSVWESLSTADPYYHAKVIGNEPERIEEEIYYETWQGGIWPPDGKHYEPGAFKVEKVRKKKIGNKVVTKTVLAPYLDPQAIGELATLTHSQAPIVMGVWFFQQTAIQFGRKPGYYDFLGIKDQKTFETLVGFDEKQSRKFANLWREAVSRSGVVVGRRPRRLERFKSLGGGLWRSLDSKVTVDKANPLRVLDDVLTFDATEQLASGPNGMIIWGLFNAKGERQDTAPDFIASDQNGVANDSRVHINVSCVRCHNNAGIKDFTPWARKLFAPPRSLESPDYDVLKDLRQQYLRALEPHIEDDRRVYARAIWAATGGIKPHGIVVAKDGSTSQGIVWSDVGMKPEVWSKSYYDTWEYHVDAKVDLAWVARTLGTTPEHFQKSLVHVKKTTGQIDPVLATFLAPVAEPIAVESWEECYQMAQLYIRGVTP